VPQRLCFPDLRARIAGPGADTVGGDDGVHRSRTTSGRARAPSPPRRRTAADRSRCHDEDILKIQTESSLLPFLVVKASGVVPLLIGLKQRILFSNGSYVDIR